MDKRSTIQRLRATFRWRTLRTKIIAWFFVPATIILVAVALVAFISYQQVTENLVLERDQKLIRLSAGQLAAELTTHANSLTTVARLTQAYMYYPPALQVTLSRARNPLAVFDGGVVILDNFGTVVATEPERPDIVGQNWSNRDYFRQMVHSPRQLFSNMVADGPEGAEVIAVAVPIIGNQGEFLGAVVGMYRLDTTLAGTFYDSIVKLRLSENGSNYLVDGNGRVIYHSDADLIGADFTARSVTQPVFTGQAGAVRAQDLQGRATVVGFAPVPGTAWTLVAEESWDVLTSSSRRYQQFLLLLLGLGVVVPALVVAIGLRRIMQPIEALMQAAQAVARGQFGQTITAKTGDEIEELAKQFNLMSAKLQESYTHLEQRVADRTRELAILNAIGVLVNESLELYPTLDRILDETLDLLNMEVGEVCLLDEVTDELVIRSERGLSLEFVRQANRRQVSDVLPRHCVQSGEPVIEEDVSTCSGQQLAKQEGLRAIAIFPLRAKDSLLGTLCLATRRGPRSFSRSERELLRAISDQAAVAIENARLYAETHRRIDEIETLFAVQQAITGDLNVAAVLQLIADEARRLTSSKITLLFLVNGNDLELSVLSSDAPLDDVSVGYRLPLAGSLTEATFQSGAPLRVDDPQSNERASTDLVQRLGIHSLMIVPLISGSEPLGSISVVNKEPGSFNFDDERVMAMIASSAVIGIENARLYQREQERRYEAEQRRRIAEGLREILTILNSTRPLKQILDDIAAQAGRLLRTGAVAIYRLDNEEGVLRIQAARGLPPQYVAEMAIPLGQGAVGRAVQTGQPASIPDLPFGEVEASIISDKPRQIYQTHLRGRYSALLAVPLTIKDEVYGGIVLYYPEPRHFSAEEVALAVSFANQAALAIENARLFAQAEQAAILEERQRLARDLHDSVTQALYGVTMFAEAAARLLEVGNTTVAAKHLREVRETAQEALQEMRLLLFELRPPILEKEGLAVALQARLEAVEGRAGISTALETDGVDRLPPEVEEGLYRIAQEALNNILKHAHAQKVTAYLGRVDNRVILEITDDGIGFDPPTAQGQGGLGLGGMAERAAHIGGSLSINSQPEQGTTIRVELEFTEKVTAITGGTVDD